MTQLENIKNRLQKNQRLPMIISVVCLLLLILIIVQTVRTLTSGEIKISHPVKTATPSQTLRLADWHLFGMYDENLNALPKTQLLLSLQAGLWTNSNIFLK